MRLSRNEIDREIQELTVNDPTNFARRLAEAQAINAEFYRQHPDGWATTPRRGIQAERSIRHHEITIGRNMSEQEKDAYLRQLSDPSK